MSADRSIAAHDHRNQSGETDAGTRHAELRDGTRILVRPIRPTDRDGLASSFERLSPESRYRRFLSPVAHLSARELDYLVNVDHERHEALVAQSEEGEPLGVARFVRLEDPCVAEVAVAVADDWHGRGVGTVLLAHLLARARELGVQEFTATVLADNEESLAVLAPLGEMTVGRPQYGAVEVTLRLPHVRNPDDALRHVLRAAARGDVHARAWRPDG